MCSYLPAFFRILSSTPLPFFVVTTFGPPFVMRTPTRTVLFGFATPYPPFAMKCFA